MQVAVMAKKTLPGFDVQLKELEQLVANMEKGDLSLEDALKQYEDGIALVRACEKQLAEAEQKVQILSRQGNEETLTDFDESR